MTSSRRQAVLLAAGALVLAGAGVALWLDVRSAPANVATTEPNDTHADHAASTPAPALAAASDAGVVTARRITGTVRLYGKPLPGASIGVGQRRSWLVDIDHPVTTDAAGRFAFDAPTSEFELVVTGYEVTPVTFVAAGTAPQQLDVTVVDEVEVRGRVTYGGVPVPTAQVFLPGGPFVDANAQGEYRLRGFNSGAYLIGAVDRATGRRAGWQQLIIAKGEHRGAVDLVLQAAAMLDVEIVDADGNPMPDAVVQVNGEDAHRGVNSHGHVLLAVAEGDIELGARVIGRDDLSVKRTVTTRTSDAAVPVRLAFAVRAGRTIRGVVHYADGKPAAVTVHVGWRETHTDATGHFVVGDLIEGTYQVSVQVAFTVIRDKPVQTDTSIDLVLPRLGALEITAAGVGDHCEAHIVAQYTGAQRSTPFDCAHGPFTIRDLAPGRYAVSLTGTLGFADAMVELREGETRQLALTAARGGTLRGTARAFPDGAIVPSLHCSTSYPTREFTTDAGGGFALDNLPPSLVISCTATIGTRRLRTDQRLLAPTGDTTVELWLVDDPSTRYDDALGAQLHITHDGALEFASIVEGGPTAVAGIAVGDQVVTVAGRAVSGDNVQAARAYIKSRPHGAAIDLSIRSNGAAYAIPLTIQIPP